MKVKKVGFALIGMTLFVSASSQAFGIRDLIEVLGDTVRAGRVASVDNVEDLAARHKPATIAAWYEGVLQGPDYNTVAVADSARILGSENTIEGLERTLKRLKPETRVAVMGKLVRLRSDKPRRRAAIGEVRAANGQFFSPMERQVLSGAVREAMSAKQLRGRDMDEARFVDFAVDIDAGLERAI